MVRKKWKSAIAVDDDDVDNELRDCFKQTAKTFGISRGKLLSRAFYLVCLEALGEKNMKTLLDECRASPLDPRRPLNEDFLVDTEIWVESLPFVKALKRTFSPDYKLGTD